MQTTNSNAIMSLIYGAISAGITRQCVAVRRGDVLSAWSGIRPLVSDPNKPDTQSLARNHIVHVSPAGLVTIAGGKWTTYRSMAAETIDAAVESQYQSIIQ
jgi:glycerol-3-phosphate dehydrogenase